MTDIAKRVALALAKANPYAGMSLEKDEKETVEQRAENLLRLGYVEAGDPYEWSPGALATIYMEPRGGPGDCNIPLDYWGSGMEYSFKASNILGDCYIDFVNAAVAAVHE